MKECDGRLRVRDVDGWLRPVVEPALPDVFQTPTIVIHNGAPSPVPVSTRCPSASSCGQYLARQRVVDDHRRRGAGAIAIVEEAAGAQLCANRLQVLDADQTKERILPEPARRRLVLDLQRHVVGAGGVGQIRGQPHAFDTGKCSDVGEHVSVELPPASGIRVLG